MWRWRVHILKSGLSIHHIIRSPADWIQGVIYRWLWTCIGKLRTTCRTTSNWKRGGYFSSFTSSWSNYRVNSDGIVFLPFCFFVPFPWRRGIACLGSSRSSGLWSTTRSSCLRPSDQRRENRRRRERARPGQAWRSRRSNLQLKGRWIFRWWISTRSRSRRANGRTGRDSGRKWPIGTTTTQNGMRAQRPHWNDSGRRTAMGFRLLNKKILRSRTSSSRLVGSSTILFLFLSCSWHRCTIINWHRKFWSCVLDSSSSTWHY